MTDLLSEQNNRLRPVEKQLSRLNSEILRHTPPSAIVTKEGHVVVMEDNFNHMFNGAFADDPEKSIFDYIPVDYRAFLIDLFDRTQEGNEAKMAWIPFTEEKNPKFYHMTADRADQDYFIKLESPIEVVDTLTGLYTRPLFDVELDRLTNARESYSILYLDVDYLKRTNNNFSHDDGDELLRRVGAIIQLSTRDSVDLAAHLSGDEFGILLTNADENVAKIVIDRIKTAFHYFNFPDEYPEDESTRKFIDEIRDKIGVRQDGMPTLSASVGYSVGTVERGVSQPDPKEVFAEAERNCMQNKAEQKRRRHFQMSKNRPKRN